MGYVTDETWDKGQGDSEDDFEVLALGDCVAGGGHFHSRLHMQQRSAQ